MSGEIQDDASIADECRMLRRVHPDWVKDFRPDSSNFKNKRSDTGLSVTAWVVDTDLSIVIDEAPRFGVICVDAADLRAAGYAIVRRPLDENGNHCECFGSPTGGARKELARIARWVKPPAEHDPAPYGALETFEAANE
jgi:hypothetical protein